MKDLKKQIVKEYEHVELRHPTLQEIADKVGCSKSYVHRVVELYKAQNQAFGVKK